MPTGHIFSLITEWPLFKLNSHHLRVLGTEFGSKEDDFLSLSIYFHFYLPLEKDMVLHLIKHDFPSPKDALCQVWLKFARGS